jgi:hypothetical protein
MLGSQIRMWRGRRSPATRGAILVNGRATFDDLFGLLNEARASANGAFHLAGWSMHADAELGKRPEDAQADFPITLTQAAELIGGAGGRCRFLAADFVQVSDPASLEAITIFMLYLLVAGELLGRSPASAAPREGTGCCSVLPCCWATLFSRTRSSLP